MKNLTAFLSALTLSFTVMAQNVTDLPATAAHAYFAGGCFWCIESEFNGKDGVLDVISGYTGGTVENPSYEAVSAGTTGHAEAIEVTYDTTQTSYDKLLDIFFNAHDPTDAGGQGADRGEQYRTAIFYQNAAELDAAKAKIAELDAAHTFKAPIVTRLEPFKVFYQAEEYHQNYYQRNPISGAVRTQFKKQRLKQILAE